MRPLRYVGDRSHPAPVHHVEPEFLPSAITELRCPRAGRIGHLRYLLQRAAVREIRDDAGRAGTVGAESATDAGRGGALAGHRIGISLGMGMMRCP
jgi:hypothetical protein